MTGKQVHRVIGMVACHYRGKIKLLTDEDFRDWREILMRDLNDLESMEFGMVALGLAKSSWRSKLWARRFCKRLDFIDWVRLRQRDYAFEAKEAQKYADDYLEVYRYRFYETISISSEFVTMQDPGDTNDMPDDAMELITITVHNSRSILDRVLNRFGLPARKIAILRPAIERLEGTCENFYIYAGDSCYHFDAAGVEESNWVREEEFDVDEDA